MSGDQVRLDPTSLRGIAHPLRVRMLAVLREYGPATATTLAQRLGQSTGATSYHLRQLAAYGFVVEDPELGVGRERWWRAAHRGTTLDAATVARSPENAEAFARAVAAYHADQVERWLGEGLHTNPDWLGCSELSDWRFRLTASEAKELRDEIYALVARYRVDDAGTPAPVDAEKVVLQVQLMPLIRSGDASIEDEPR